MTGGAAPAPGSAPVDPRVLHDPHHAARMHVAVADDLRVAVKPGVRGYPDAPPGVAELAPFVRREVSGIEADAPLVLDASGAAGALARVALAARDAAVTVRVLEPSAAALACAAESLREDPRAHLLAACPWDAGDAAPDDPRAASLVVLLPPADRGSGRVHAEIACAARALAPGGSLLLALHKDRGGKRYLQDAERWFEDVAVVGRAKGWRIGLARRPRVERAGGHAAGGGPAGTDAPWIAFEAAGRTFAALPGVFAAGKLDPGTRELLEAMRAHGVEASLDGARVLDLGCGYGALAVWAAAAGAVVTAADDDLAAVRSTRRSALLAGVPAAAVHSDLDAAFGADDRFDAVVCNPPFHVGKQVRLDLSQAFVRAAHRRLVDGGVLWLVANRAIPYEEWLGAWRSAEVVRAERGFKVLRAVR